MDGVRDAVLVAVAEGVGTCVLSNGQLVSGITGWRGSSATCRSIPTEPRCGCGKKGCWEMFGSTRAALRYFRDLRPKSHVVTFQELLNLAEEGDAAAAQALAMQAQGIGRGLRMIIAGLSPSTILIAGDVTSAWHRFGPVIEKEAIDLTLAGEPAGDSACS